MRTAALVLGYHGCDREVGERILGGSGGHLQPSENDYDWVGSGIYFWEDNPRRALEWAEFVRENPQRSRARIRYPFAIGAIIPVLPFMFIEGFTAIAVSTVLSALGLVVIGAAITLFTGRSILFSSTRQVLFGLAAAAITYGIGRLIGVNISG